MADLFEVHDKALAGVSRVLHEARDRIAVLENDWKDTSAAAIQAARERDEWKAAVAAAPEPWRRLLWLRHGCPISSLYGDDGEMQCAACGLDFKRQPAAEIEARWKRINENALLAAELNKIPNPCCGKTGPCRMDAPDGPVCHCGKPSTEQSGLCGDCAVALQSKPEGEPQCKPQS